MESDLEVKGDLDYLVSWFSCYSVWLLWRGNPQAHSVLGFQVRSDLKEGLVLKV